MMVWHLEKKNPDSTACSSFQALTGPCKEQEEVGTSVHTASKVGRWMLSLLGDATDVTHDHTDLLFLSSSLHRIPCTGDVSRAHAPQFCSFRLWRFIHHLFTYLLMTKVTRGLALKTNADLDI